MKISEMLYSEKVKPASIAAHPDLTRAAWTLKSIGYPTPLDSILRGQREIAAQKLHDLGM